MAKSESSDDTYEIDDFYSDTESEKSSVKRTEETKGLTLKSDEIEEEELNA